MITIPEIPIGIRVQQLRVDRGRGGAQVVWRVEHVITGSSVDVPSDEIATALQRICFRRILDGDPRLTPSQMTALANVIACAMAVRFLTTYRETTYAGS